MPWTNWPPHTFLGEVASTAIFGFLGILLIVLGFKVFDWLCPKIDVERELAENHNIAVAIVIAAVILGVSVVIAAVLVTPAVITGP
jgi:putative membrane protein